MKRKNKEKGVIIEFAGIDQSGKATQAKMLADLLARRRRRHSTFAFPDRQTPVGRLIDEILTGKTSQHANKYLLSVLFAANRYEKSNEIQSDVEDGKIVIIDRYSESGVIYGQARFGFADKQAGNFLRLLESGLPPADLVIWIDLPVTESFQRKRANRDLIEKDGHYLEKCRNYFDFASRQDVRYQKIDGLATPEKAHDQIISILKEKKVI